MWCMNVYMVCAVYVSGGVGGGRGSMHGRCICIYFIHTYTCVYTYTSYTFVIHIVYVYPAESRSQPIIHCIYILYTVYIHIHSYTWLYTMYMYVIRKVPVYDKKGHRSPGRGLGPTDRQPSAWSGQVKRCM